MKKLITISLFAALLTTGTALKAQQEPREYLGLPGDNLNLYAVMQLFQDSKTLEDFERELNDPKSNINNLDLNDDNLVDYLNVVDNVDNNVHNIVIQDQLGPREIQDVAVFTVQRFNNGQVQIQLTGDEALYGKNYIIEPIFDNEGGTPNPGYTGNATVVNGNTVTVVTTTPVQIAAWPVIRFIYSPRYVVWHSSWHWGYYPRWYHPWRPYYWDYYYGYHHNLYPHYYRYYRKWNTHRYNNWHDSYYISHHTYSPMVHKRIETGTYKKTYSQPDQRRAGEDAYRKTYNSQNRRTNGSAGAPARVNRNNTGTGRPEVSTNRTTVTRRTTTGTTSTRKTYTNQNNNARSEKQAATPRSYNRTTVTRTTKTEVKNNGSRSASRRSAGVSSSSNKPAKSKANKASKESKKTSSGNKKSESSKPARRK